MNYLMIVNLAIIKDLGFVMIMQNEMQIEDKW